MKLTRRKFIYIFISSIFILLFNNSNVFEDTLIFDQELKKNIFNFNQKRLSNLKKNLKNEIKEDLINGRTIWVQNKIYTYAEVNMINSF